MQNIVLPLFVFINMESEHIPEQYTGASVDVVNSKSFDSFEDAKEFYIIARKKLLSVNDWENIAGSGSADFQLYSADKKPAQRLAQKGDYFRINIPGPNNPSGDGDDWVQVQNIIEEEGVESTCTSITVSPVSCPLNDDKDVAHFFTDVASSTFIVRYHNNEVFAEVHGRNEKPNIKNVDAGDMIRNTLVASGSVLGFSKFQWKKLTTGLMEQPKREL